MRPTFLNPSALGAPPRAAASLSPWLWLLVPLWLAATAGLRPLALPDEGRYVGVAWEMLRSGDWLVPQLNGLPYFHKPPLFYWLTAASLAVFGPSAWAARLAPCLGALLAAWSLHAFLRRWAGPRQARATLVVWLAQPLCFLGAQYANMDMLVAGCITATIVCLAHAALLAESGGRAGGWLPVAYGLAGLGVLAKGLIGVALPALVVGAWLLLRGRWRGLRGLVSLPGLAVLAAVTVPWFALVQARQPGCLHYMFVVQQVQRYAGAGFNNVQPLWFYPALLLLASLPWAPALLRVAAGLRLAPARAAVLALRADPLRLLMAVWLLGVLLFFSLPSSKLLGYVLPAVPPWACMVVWAHPGGGRAHRRALVAGAVLAACCGLAVVAWTTTHHPKSSRALAGALQARLQPGDAVLQLDRYDFDLAFYARLQAPSAVVAAWDDPALTRADSWYRELADAARFAPAQGAQRLLRPADLPGHVCGTRTAWLLGTEDARRRLPALQAATPVAVDGQQVLWRLQGWSADPAHDTACLPGATDAAPGASPAAAALSASRSRSAARPG